MRLDETIASDGASSVVAVVTNGNGQILLGKSTDSDRRNGKWCFTGGGIKNKEITIEAAAERECWEESGLHCRAQGIIQYGNGFEVPPSVVFVLCVADAAGNIRHNKEFSEMKWARPSEALAWPDLFGPNRRIIEKMLDHPLMEAEDPLSGASKDHLRAFVDGVAEAEASTRGIGERIPHVDPPKDAGQRWWGTYGPFWDMGWYYRTLIGPLPDDWWLDPGHIFYTVDAAIAKRQEEQGHEGGGMLPEAAPLPVPVGYVFEGQFYCAGCWLASAAMEDDPYDELDAQPLYRGTHPGICAQCGETHGVDHAPSATIDKRDL
jgi:8-oxo-dGTP pyrophosphatase MutT (NUDIX family)